MKIPKLAVNDLTAYHIRDGSNILLMVSKVVSIIDKGWGEIPLGVKAKNGKWYDPPKYTHPFKMNTDMLCSSEDQKIPPESAASGTSGCVFQLAKNSKVYAEAMKLSK